MDYVAEINKVLQDLQDMTVVTSYGNVKKLSRCMERLVAIADDLKQPKVEVTECRPEED